MDAHLNMLKPFIGEEVGVSPWIEITQDMIDAHAQTTGDNAWIHTDPERAATESQFGCTIAQSFLLVSLLTQMSQSIELPTEGVVYRTNYGVDRLRVLQPVMVNNRVRARFELKNAQPKTRHGVLVYLDVAIEIEGDEFAPAIVAECLVFRQLEK